MGGKGKKGKGGGKGKGGKGKGGKGKGRGGKGKGKGRPVQLRKELASTVDVLFRQAGETESQNPRYMHPKDRAKFKKAAPKGQTRKEMRKAKKEDKKQRRVHFHGEGRRVRLGRPAKVPPKAGKAGDEIEEISLDSPKQGPSRQPASKGKGKGSKAQRKRKMEEEESITSDEEGGDASDDDDGKPPRGKQRRKAEEESEEDDEELEGEEEEEEGEGEEEEADPGSGESENEEAAEVAPAKASGSYVPPHLRNAAAKAAAKRGAKNSDAMARLRKALRGLMNRVTEGNLDPSSRELHATLASLIPEVGVQHAADGLLEVLLPAAIGDPNASVLVLGCHAALVVATHVLFGAAFGAAALLQVGTWLKRRLLLAETSGEVIGEDARVAKNCITFQALLFSFGALPASSVFDLVRFIFAGDQVSEVRIELALTALRYAGRGLRSEHAEGFREMLGFVSTAAENARTAEKGSIQTRVDFLLQELQDLKNNKVSFAAMDRFEAIRNWLGNAPLLVGKKVADHQLAVPFNFLTEDKPADWPIAAAGATSSILGSSKRSKTAGAKGADPLRAMAVEQRLSSELRQSLFAALMGAEDYEHAAERLSQVASGAKLGVADTCIIIFHCAVREKMPNPFYEHVAISLTERPAPYGKRFTHNLKRAAVQNLKEVHTYGLRATVNLAELCASLISNPSSGLPLAICRFMNFAESSSMAGLFLRHMMGSLLRRLPDAAATCSCFETIRKYEDVREGLLLVMDTLLKGKLPSKREDPALWEKVRSARRMLATPAGKD